MVSSLDINVCEGKDLLEALISEGVVVLKNWTDISDDKLDNSCLDLGTEYFLDIHTKGDSIKNKKQNLVSIALESLSDTSTSLPSIKLNDLTIGKCKGVPEGLSTKLGNVSETILSLISTSFGFGYTYWESCTKSQGWSISSIPGSGKLNNWNLLSILMLQSPVQLVLRANEEPIDVFASKKTPVVILSIGKVLEIMTKGLLFNSSLRLIGDFFQCIQYQLLPDLDLKVQDLIEYTKDEFIKKRTDFTLLFLKRVWEINFMKDATIGQYKGKAYFNNTHTNIHTGKKHMYGYLVNNNDILPIDDKFQLSFVCFDTSEDPYLICFKVEKTVGEILSYEIICQTHKINRALEPYYENIIEEAVIRLKTKKNEDIEQEILFLQRIFANLDNILFIYFLDHTNLPSLTRRIIPNLIKLLSKNVEVLDILKIKYIYPDSFEIFKVMNDSNNVLIGVPKSQLETTNIAQQISLRKEEFIKQIDIFLKDSERVNLMEKEINNMYQNLEEIASRTPVPTPGASPHKWAASRTPSPLKKTPVIKKYGNLLSSVGKITKVDLGGSPEKLSLRDRIRLKEKLQLEAVRRAKTEAEEEFNKGFSGLTFGELVMVFEILADLNTSGSMTSYPLKYLLTKLSDSLRANNNLLSQELIKRILMLLGLRLPNDMIETVDLGKDNTIVKINLWNKREEVMELLSK